MILAIPDNMIEEGHRKAGRQVQAWCHAGRARRPRRSPAICRAQGWRSSRIPVVRIFSDGPTWRRSATYFGGLKAKQAIVYALLPALKNFLGRRTYPSAWHARHALASDRGPDGDSRAGPVGIVCLPASPSLRSHGRAVPRCVGKSGARLRPRPPQCRVGDPVRSASRIRISDAANKAVNAPRRRSCGGLEEVFERDAVAENIRMITSVRRAEAQDAEDGSCKGKRRPGDRDGFDHESRTRRCRLCRRMRFARRHQLGRVRARSAAQGGDLQRCWRGQG